MSVMLLTAGEAAQRYRIRATKLQTLIQAAALAEIAKRPGRSLLPH